MTELQEATHRLNFVPPQTSIEVTTGVTIRRKKNGLTVMRLHYAAVPERNPATEAGQEWYRRERKKYASEARWRKEQEIDAYATGGEAVFGKILSEFYDVVVISDPNWYPDPRWDVIGAFDHGVANATCLLKGYVPRKEIDPKTGKPKPTEVYLCGEYYSNRRPGWANNVDQNCEAIMKGGTDADGNPFLPMPDIDRARWIMADPSIFYLTQVEKKGDPTNIYATYRKNNFLKLKPYEGIRSDITFVEWMMSDYWRGVANGAKPRLHIVCRNPSDRQQPGMHPYDCPNLLWELKRARRVEMTARQLLTKNPSENLQDKNNHARDCLKYLTGMLRSATPIPLEEEVAAQLTGLDPTTQNIRARFLMSDLAMKGQVNIDGSIRNKKSAVTVDMRRSRGVLPRMGGTANIRPAHPGRGR